MNTVAWMQPVGDFGARMALAWPPAATIDAGMDGRFRTRARIEQPL